jgi:DNA-binding CsgD family transcriptional regulator
MVAVTVMSTWWPMMSFGTRRPRARRSSWVRAVRVADPPCGDTSTSPVSLVRVPRAVPGVNGPLAGGQRHGCGGGHRVLPFPAGRVDVVWLGDADTAERVYQEFAGLAPAYMGDGSGAPFSGRSAQRLIGDFALAAGRVDEAVRRYADAIEMNARIGARPFLALSRLGLARALVASADPGDLRAARALVTEAAAEFRRLDLPGPLASADALLTEIGVAARAASPLSPREAEIAALIADALSNRQIAQQLVLSERTVETHVRSILAKLGFSTRTEIATWSLRASRLRRARAAPGLPLRAGDPVHHPVAVILGEGADVRPAGPLEDGPHGHVGGIGRRLDGLRGRVPEQPVGQQDQRLVPVAPAAGVRVQADPHLIGPAGNRAAGRHERLDAPDRHPVQVYGQIETAIGHDRSKLHTVDADRRPEENTGHASRRAGP